MFLSSQLSLADILSIKYTHSFYWCANKGLSLLPKWKDLEERGGWTCRGGGIHDWRGNFSGLETLIERGAAAKPRPQDPHSWRKRGLQRQPEGQGEELVCTSGGSPAEISSSEPGFPKLLSYAFGKGPISSRDFEMSAKLSNFFL